MGKGWGSRSVPEQGGDTAGVEVTATGTGQRMRRLVCSLVLVLGAFTGIGALAVATAAPSFAAGAPTVADGYGAYGNSPVVNLTGCTGASGQETLTCATNPITAGVTVGMGGVRPEHRQHHARLGLLGDCDHRRPLRQHCPLRSPQPRRSPSRAPKGSGTPSTPRRPPP